MGQAIKYNPRDFATRVRYNDFDHTIADLANWLTEHGFVDEWYSFGGNWRDFRNGDISVTLDVNPYAKHTDEDDKISYPFFINVMRGCSHWYICSDMQSMIDKIEELGGDA